MSSFNHGHDPAPMGCDQGIELDEMYPLGKFMRENKAKVEQLQKQIAAMARKRR